MEPEAIYSLELDAFKGRSYSFCWHVDRHYPQGRPGVKSVEASLVEAFRFQEADGGYPGYQGPPRTD
jgi:hypothetical protein